MTDPTPTPLVQFRGVRKLYGSAIAVKSLDLDIGRGEFVALMGPSGCGKTTTLRMLAGLETPTAGSITIGGKLMNDVPAHQRDTPLVWQSLALFPFLSVVENVEFGLRMRGVAAGERRSRAMMWLERMGLQGFEARRIDQLSGGQRQRVALARSLVTEPEMLLLDEPLSALDAHLVIRMQGVLTKLQRELGITFVYVTHSHSEAFAMADRVVIMGHGEIEQIGAPREIFRTPRSRFVAEFVGRNNIIAGVVAGGILSSEHGAFPIAAPDGSAEIVVAADTVTVLRAPPEAGPAVKVAFLSEEFAGTGIICYFEAADGSEFKAQVTEEQLADLQPEPGAAFWLSWDPARVHVMGG
ncbi:ABC transporter ATP-binding protein [Frigidibacter sp.]|uniref:ABC transporter ATP-binding protein n=1 Tax=Frigidibacter sp. TaxID=2586418 RepID=UPI00273742AA|nr:ABC transporter ATP-binding protein [Frigidibacter sp.]MDP3339337.1 ABC transporter ATP-binding protein [Frigidibacter sp.]